MNKFCFIDTETTGVDFNKNGIVQISGMVYFDDEEKETFDFRIQPFESDVLDEKALQVNGLTKEILFSADREMPAVAKQRFTALLGKYVDKFNREDKFFFVGYNARFDADFIRKFFEKCGDSYFGSWFCFPPIDVMNLAVVALLDKRSTMLNFKLSTVADTLGLKPDGSLHDALTDIKLTREIFGRIKKLNLTLIDKGADYGRTQ